MTAANPNFSTPSQPAGLFDPALAGERFTLATLQATILPRRRRMDVKGPIAEEKTLRPFSTRRHDHGAGGNGAGGRGAHRSHSRAMTIMRT